MSYIKAFAKALTEHLRGTVSEFTERFFGADGCPTCGHGASKYDVLDMDKLKAEIDKFAATFEKTL